MNYKIDTARLSLRPPQMIDDSRLYQLMSQEDITTFLSWDAHQSIETTRAVISGLIESQNAEKGYHWCIYHQDAIIGLVSLIDVRRKIRTWTLNRAEVSYWISPNFQGQGFATEATQAVLEFGFSKLSLHKIIIAHAVANGASKRICEKLGFEKYAHEHDAFKKEGQWHDLVWYEIIKGK